MKVYQKNTTIRIINIKNRNTLKMLIIESDIVKLGSANIMRKQGIQNKRQQSLNPKFHQILIGCRAGSALLYMLISTRSTVLRICSVPAPAVLSLPEQMDSISVAAIKLNLAQSRQKVTHQNNNITFGYFL